ncbi:hypothetical protein ADK38_13230 [Streptomyces varsoviensis]|uniref:Uncharacterized protein n=1 Tax=Streptomyces varsoviensis TaxID=67373 RepID=A0ABR5J867_9ACTN|nr:hypothetical protein ADK38_13230 [Streptomyces varsoviensis]
MLRTGFDQAEWSCDGPSKQFEPQERKLPDGALELLNVDTTGITDDSNQYPVLQKYGAAGLSAALSSVSFCRIATCARQLDGLPNLS